MPDLSSKEEENTPADFILEWTHGSASTLWRAISIPNVSAYTDDPIPADHADWTLNGPPIEQHKGIRQRSLSLNGQAGIELRAYTLIDTKSRQTSTHSGGRSRFEALRGFLVEFYKECATYRSAFVQDREGTWPRMIFRALREGTSYFVRDIKLTEMESVPGSRMSYSYRLTMVAIGEAEARPDGGPLNLSVSEVIKFREDELTDLLATGTKDTLQGATSTVAEHYQKASASTSLSWIEIMRRIPAYAAAARGPIEQLFGQIKEVEQIVATTAQVYGGFPRAVVSDLYALVQKTAATVYTIADSLRDLDRERMKKLVSETLEGAFNDLERACLVLLGSAGSKAPSSTPENISRPDGGGSPSPTSTRHEQVMQGEDIFSFAQRTLGNPALWLEIARLNAMSNASTLGDGSPFEAGVILAVPSPAGDGFDLPPDNADANVFGTDVAWSIRDQDLVPVGSPPKDIAAVSGPRNLQARLIHRFTKSQGSDLTAPNLGMPEVLGRAQTDTLAALLASQTVMQATADRAVKRLKTVSFRRVANSFEADVTVIPIGGKSMTFDNIPVGVSSGGK